MTELAKEIAKDLLDIKSVFLSPKAPFTWASGIQAPIYTDNRLTMTYPKVRRAIAQGFASTIKEKYPDVEVIAGTATAGIPHAAWLADLLDLPMIYVRSKAKDHGKARQIEGELKEGQKVVLIEDLISTGGSVLEAAKAVKAEGGEVLAVMAIFNYELEQSKENFQKAGVELSTLSNYSSLIELAREIDYISQEELELLQNFQANPLDWQKSGEFVKN